MQASPAANETRLPRQVLQRAAAAEERRKAQLADPEAASAPPAAPSATPVDPNPQPAPPADPRHSDPLYWKHRFEATAGRLRVREDEHRAEVQELRRQMTELQEQVRSLQATQPSAPAEIDLTEFFSAEQIKEIGEDDARSIAQAALTAANKQARKVIEEQVKPLVDQRKADAEEILRQRKTAFVDTLEEQIPNYAEIDKSENWLAWLAEEDPDTGEVRQVTLDRHVGALNALKTAAMFRKYLKTLEVPQPPVAPSGSGAAPGAEPPPGVGAEARYPTSAEKQDYFKRAKLGKVTDAERAKFEARLKLTAGR